MTDRTIGLEQEEEILFSYEVSDVVLESAGGNEITGHYYTLAPVLACPFARADPQLKKGCQLERLAPR
jgi:hypothetical protein